MVVNINSNALSAVRQKLSDHLNNRKVISIYTGLKYLFAMLLTLKAASVLQIPQTALFGILELLLIFCMSDLLSGKQAAAGYLVNSLLMLLYNIQMILVIFGNSYLTMIMLTNIDSIELLSGNAGIYISGTILVLLFSFFPFRSGLIPRVDIHSLLTVTLAIELVLSMALGNSFSPLYGYYQVYSDCKAARDRKARLAEQPNLTSEFAHKGVLSFRERPANLKEHPNVVVIFTEGLSSHIIHDVRNIMPNVKAYEERSVRFTNYFNHTFATYRGLIGQIYSGYQMDNYDGNSLISLADVFRSQGYQSAFINVEPKNRQFSEYLGRLGFDQVIGNQDVKQSGYAGSMSDQDAFHSLYQIMEKQESSGQPFFTAIYTVGTHVASDSAINKFGDGSLDELNKFFDLDCQFGEFMRKFEQSPMADHTIIVFTTDHATYQDSFYADCFPDYERPCREVDTIPFFIYYKGVAQEEIDARGKNSLSLAPTIMDYLDISTPNYFLGASLFDLNDANDYQTVFTDGIYIMTTDYGNIRELEGEEYDRMAAYLDKYYAAKLQEPEIDLTGK